MGFRRRVAVGTAMHARSLPGLVMVSEMSYKHLPSRMCSQSGSCRTSFAESARVRSSPPAGYGDIRRRGHPRPCPGHDGQALLEPGESGLLEDFERLMADHFLQ